MCGAILEKVVSPLKITPDQQNEIAPASGERRTNVLVSLYRHHRSWPRSAINLATLLSYAGGWRTTMKGRNAASHLMSAGEEAVELTWFAALCAAIDGKPAVHP